jgi:diguanylate cyclase (GGDEF)-like protein
MSILVVDDSIDSQRLITVFLKSGGYKDIYTVSSAAEAYRFLDLQAFSEGQSVDLILMDIVMPDVNGIEACKMLKKLESVLDVPIIMVTAKTEKEELDLAFSAGAMDYITKPINKIELLARVRSALRLKHEVDERKARELELIEVTRQLAASVEVLRQLSLRDGLTGVANRRHFDEILASELSRSKREHQYLSLVMFDIDFFKAYNDRYGHLQGDDCLRLVATSAAHSLSRSGDLLARYGGEEFAVILPQTDVVGAAVVAEQIRSAVADLHIAHAASNCNDMVTISLGVGVFDPKEAIAPEDLIKRADWALYRSKENGRNQVSVNNGGA